MTAADLAACDYAVRIPMVGQVDSLNVAVAAGILVYEFARDRLP
jgi:23S rRNA (guanosine2251-2'-O)-methyltransferase